MLLLRALALLTLATWAVGQDCNGREIQEGESCTVTTAGDGTCQPNSDDDTTLVCKSASDANAAAEAETTVVDAKAAAEAKKAAADAKAATEARAAEEALVLRQKRVAEVKVLTAALEDAINDVQNHNQYMIVTKALDKLLAHPLFDGDTTGIAVGVDGIPELLQRARVLIVELERLWILKKAIAELNQKTIAEIKSFQIPLKEIEHVMRAVFLLLGDSVKKVSTWKAIKVAIGHTGKQSLKRRIQEFVPSRPIAERSVALARTLIHGVEAERISEVSVGTTAFYAWARGVLQHLEEEDD